MIRTNGGSGGRALSSSKRFHKFTDYRGRVPAGVKFVVEPVRARMIFSLRSAEQYGVGTLYHSADLFFMGDDSEEEGGGEIRLDLWESPNRGDRRIYLWNRTHYTLGVTRFLTHFNCAIREHAWYGMRFEEGETGPENCRHPARVYVDLGDWTAIPKRV